MELRDEDEMHEPKCLAELAMEMACDGMVIDMEIRDGTPYTRQQAETVRTINLQIRGSDNRPLRMPQIKVFKRKPRQGETDAVPWNTWRQLSAFLTNW